MAEVARRFKAGVVLPFAGAAQTRGPFHLTMDTNDTIETARAFPDAVIVPFHTDGWAHFRQSAQDLRVSFDALGFGKRLRILEPGVATVIERMQTSPEVRHLRRHGRARSDLPLAVARMRLRSLAG